MGVEWAYYFEFPIVPPCGGTRFGVWNKAIVTGIVWIIIIIQDLNDTGLFGCFNHSSELFHLFSSCLGGTSHSLSACFGRKRCSSASVRQTISTTSCWRGGTRASIHQSTLS
mmetsp:Transcript_109035/g.305161  ORF Transcript_109035/g.305161 Transcript_109035/m.305161 type:complete len:112 (+) Transcript_109035:124-459(+)